MGERTAPAAVYLHPGQVFAAADPSVVTTILDRVLGLGLASRRRARLAVAWLIEHGLLAEAAPGLATPPPRPRLLAHG